MPPISARHLLRCCVFSALLAALWMDLAKADPLLTAEQVHRLSLKESGLKIPVKLTGIVTYVRGIGREVVIQDGTGGVMLDWPQETENSVDVGMRVKVEGYTAIHPPTPRVVVRSAKIVGRGELPEPVTMTVAQLLNADNDGTFVECEDVIRAVSIEQGEITPARLVLELGPANDRLFVWISRWDDEVRRSFAPGATVKVRGVMMRWKTVQGMPVSSLVVVQQPSWVTIVKDPPQPAAVPLVDFSALPIATADDDFAESFRVKGTVTFSDATATVIADKGESLWIRPRDAVRFVPGDIVEAVGFPGINGPRSELEDAVLRKTGHGKPPEPVVLLPENFENREPMWVDGMRAKLRGVVTGGSSGRDDVPLLLDFGGSLIQVHFAESSLWDSLPTAQSVVEATGVLEAGLNLRIRRVGRGVGEYQLHLQSPADLTVIREGPWWNQKRMTTAFFSIAAIAGGATVWALSLNRRVTQKSKALVQEIATRRDKEILSAERRRLAGDLHDTLEQTLTGASLQLDALESGASPEPLILARRLLDRSRDELRRAVWDLTPSVLEERGFAAALESIAEEQTECTGVRISAGFDGDPAAVPDRIASHLCRVAQESITNAVRHGNASVISLRGKVDEGSVLLTVGDDGTGFSVTDAPGITGGHFGINGMKERLRRLGGKLEIESHQGAGTMIRAYCPLRGNATDR
jgi:signal transduction histidine kinase